MTHTLDREIQDRLVGYLAGEVSLSEFRNWFDSATWDFEQAANPILAELMGEITLRLAEYSDGHWTEEELRRKLTPLVKVYIVNAHSWSAGATSWICTLSSNVDVPGRITVIQTGDLGSPADIRASMVCG